MNYAFGYNNNQLLTLFCFYSKVVYLFTYLLMFCIFSYIPFAFNIVMFLSHLVKKGRKGNRRGGKEGKE